MKQFFIIISILGIISCSNNIKEGNLEKTQPKILRINVTSKVKTLFPPAISDLSSMQVASQIYEGLVKYNPYDLSIVPAVAESWSINEDMTEFTFKIRKGVYFHDNECFPEGKGRQVTAEDVKFSLTQLCSQQQPNKNFISILSKVVGAKEYYNQSKDGNPAKEIGGLQVVDNMTFKIILTKPMPYFLNSLALPYASIYPKEAYDKYKEKLFVGVGPYYIKEYPNNDIIILLKNPNYYKYDENKMQLPYIDTLEIGLENSVLADMKDFEEGKLDIIMGIPEAYVSEFMERNISNFESKTPKYVINKFSENGNNTMYNLYNSNIHNFFTNNMNILDLSIVYFEEPIIIEKDSTLLN